MYDENANLSYKTIKVTTTVKVVKGNYNAQYGGLFKDVVVIGITGPDKLDAEYIFKLNKGLVFSNYEINLSDHRYGESLELSNYKK